MSREVVKQICQLLADEIQRVCPELQTVVVLEAPPDEAAVYPAIAIFPESPWPITDDAPGEEALDSAGAPIVFNGTDALMEMGAISGSLQVCLATRLEGPRMYLEGRIGRMFFRNSMTPTRLLLTLPDVELEGVPTGASWPIAFFVESVDWIPEMVFAERRWTKLRVTTEAPILALEANSAVVQTMVAALAAGPQDLADPVTSGADVDDIVEVEQFTIVDGFVDADYP